MIHKTKLLSLVFAVSIMGGCVSLPPQNEDMQNTWADQGWANDERHWFHHADQGTNTFGIPYEWLIALEQPSLSMFGKPGKFMDQTYLSRMGFIPSPRSVKSYTSAAMHGYAAGSNTSKYAKKDYNLANLPVGFAVGGEWIDLASGKTLPIPGTGKNAQTVGLTCAACHTGQLEYNGNRILIDGGQAMVSLDKFREALALSIAFTKYVPGRFSRFAEAVLQEQNNKANKDALKKQLNIFIELGKNKADLEKTVATHSLEEGFSRLDALNRIGNQVFTVQMKIPENIYPTSAPVSFPHIWNTPWFDWVQYNSSIQQPMVRNLGESMGVSAPVNLSKPGPTLFEAAVPLETIHEMELLVSGPDHPLQAGGFGGLASPQWEALPLPSLDPQLVAAGRKLYTGDPEATDEKYRKGMCVRCHQPPLKDKAILNNKYWRKPKGENFPYAYLRLVTQPVEKMGTDCATAYDMAYRTVLTPKSMMDEHASVTVESYPAACPPPIARPETPEGMVRNNFGIALGQVVEKTKDYWYEKHKMSQGERIKLDGFRPNGIRATINDLPVYKARPLNGVWATAPFLHNGSVPTLYLLLSSQEERNKEAKEFYLGSRVFDPKYIGYAYRTNAGKILTDMEALKTSDGLFKLDTSKPGNHNTGHLFSSTSGPGRIGPSLSPKERLAIIEFIKSI